MTADNKSVRDDGLDELLSDFLDESSQLLDRLNENLLHLDEWARDLGENSTARCDEELMNDMFRSAHSIKGLSGMLGLSHVNHLTHRIENVFDAARKNELSLNGEVVEVVFQAVDRLTAMVNKLREEGSDNVDCQSAIAGMEKILDAAGCNRKQSTQADAELACQAIATEAAPSSTPQVTPKLTPEIFISGVMPMVPAKVDLRRIVTEQFADLEDSTEIPPKYLSIFLDEAEMSLDELTESLLSGESHHSSSAVETVLIVAHKLKGSAASVGLNRPARLAHFMEDLLQELSEQEACLTPELTDALLRCTDGLRSYLAGLRQGAAESSSFPELASDLLVAHENKSKIVNSAMKSTSVPAPSSPAAQQPEVVAYSAPAADELAQAQSPKTAAASPATRTISTDLAERIRKDSGESSRTMVGRLWFNPGLALAGLKAQLVYEKLMHLGRVSYAEPPMEGVDELDSLTIMTFGLVSDHSADQIRGRLRIAGVDHLIVLSRPCDEEEASNEATAVGESGNVEANSAKKSDEEATNPASKRAVGDATAKPSETLRVDIERLDHLMNLAGQLVINKARFAQVGEKLKASMFSKQTPQILNNARTSLERMLDESDKDRGRLDPAVELESVRMYARRLQADLESLSREVNQMANIRSNINGLFEAVHQLERVADGIQKSVMDTRMVPIGPLFGRFKRVIRDITRANAKDIRLEIHGEKTELDKRMIDELGDPLIHMVRNSADHGVESPDAREAAGKPRQGTITLDAFHRGNSIVIQVQDDGKGLDREKIVKKAIEKNLITPADAERMTPQQVYQLIWEPGFSTAEKVTEISGRGMGMDIVRAKIEELNGAVECDSKPGQGTTFTIKLPLTLAILPSLLAEIGGEVFALPVESIVEIVSVERKDMQTVHGMPTACIRGRVVSIVRLDEVFDWSWPAPRPTMQGEKRTLVIIGSEGSEMGLAVDSLLGEEDVVIKSMAENYRNVPGVAGASILGDGRVSLILDVSALIEMSSRSATAAAAV